MAAAPRDNSVNPTILRESRKDHPVAWANFVNSAARNEVALFCFFEGKDNAYYAPRIRLIAPKYQPFSCKGRDAVLAIHRLCAIHNEYHKYKKAFFIDRDFNPPLPEQHPPIFETPCYSIENLYVDRVVFSELLANLLHFPQHDEAFDECLQLYAKLQSQFHRAVLLFNAWYACLIDMRNGGTENIQAKLDDKLPTNFVLFSLDQISSTYTKEDIAAKFPNAPKVEEEALNKKCSDFECLNQSAIFRGKYELQFLIEFVRLLLNKKVSSFASKISFSHGDGSGLNNEQALELFSPYAQTPEALTAYLSLVAGGQAK